MYTLTDRDALRRAIRDPTLDRWLRAVLRLRLEQLGGVGADFHVLAPGDAAADAEAAVGWPVVLDGEPQWEWARRHHGGLRNMQRSPQQVVNPPYASSARTPGYCFPRKARRHDASRGLNGCSDQSAEG